MTRRAQGTGSIYRRENGTYAAQVDLGRDANGKRRRKTVSGRTKAEVVKKMREVHSALEQGKPVLDERRLLGDFLDHWLEDVVRPRRGHDTWKSYEQRVRLYIKPALGRVPLARLTVEDVERLLSEVRKRGLSARSVHYVRQTMSAALSVAERRGYVARNVARLTEPEPVDRSPAKPYTPDEVERLLATAADHRIGAFFTVALALGLRPEEALGLRWIDLDLDERPVLRVEQVLKREDGEVRFRKPKTDRSRRTIPLPRVCADALRRHRALQAQERLVAGPAWEDSGLVFTSRLGRPLDHRNVSRIWDRIQERAGVERHRLYDTRHTAASILLAQGVPARVVMEVFGHSSYQLTMNTYSHVMPALLDEAADAIDRALGSN